MQNIFMSYDAATEYLKYQNIVREKKAELAAAENKQTIEWENVKTMEARTDYMPKDEYEAIYNAYEMAIAIRKDIEYKLELAEQAMKLFRELNECLSDIEDLNSNKG